MFWDFWASYIILFSHSVSSKTIAVIHSIIVIANRSNYIAFIKKKHIFSLSGFLFTNYVLSLKVGEGRTWTKDLFNDFHKIIVCNIGKTASHLITNIKMQIMIILRILSLVNFITQMIFFQHTHYYYYSNS